MPIFENNQQTINLQAMLEFGDGDNGDVWAGNSSTTGHVNVNGSTTGGLQTPDDIDWIQVDLVAGASYTISLTGYGSSPVSDTYLRVWAPGSNNPSSGVLVGENDDSDGLYSELNFTASTTGTYYIDVRSYNGWYDGDYEVSVASVNPFSMQEIADYLRFGYWQDTGRSARSYNVGGDNALSVDISSLSSAYQGYAIQALTTWTDITGINFTFTSGTAEIEIDSTTGAGAGNFSSVSGSTITQSSIDIQPGWSNAWYTLQTFIHELGHALGLGHGGNYNGSATYGIDNDYLNDSWQATIMSYFDQDENTYINASYNYLLTPMLADVIAMQDIYGVSTTTRTGNTIYGYNSNAGDVYEFDNWNANYGRTTFALTIVDSNGIDTLDLSGSSSNNNVSLVQNTYSDVMGSIGNLGIGNGTVIENAIGGSGNDTILGNSANNNLDGGLGDDSIIGAGGNDILYGRGGSDSLVGAANIDTVHGGAGHDSLFGGDDGDLLWGNSGNDQIFGQQGNDQIGGGDNWDRIHGGSQHDTIWGGNGGDALWGNSGNDLIYGGSGDDQMGGGDHWDRLIGGSGNDTMWGGNGDDFFYFADGFGDDTVMDFNPSGSERIFLTNVTNITSYSDLINNHLSSNSSGYALISDGVDSITLMNVSVGQLTADDFIF